MEAVAANRLARPGLHQVTLSVYATVDPLASNPAVEAFSQLLNIISPEDAALAPESLGEIVPLLVGDPSRFQIALDTIVRLDLYEALTGLHRLLLAGNEKALLAAAAVAGDPATDSLIKDLIQTSASGLTAGARDLLLTRLDQSYEPASEIGRFERLVRWPQIDVFRAPVPAVIVEPPSESFNPAAHLRTVVEMARLGCTVYRPSRLPVDSRFKHVPVIGPHATDESFRVTERFTAYQSKRIVQALNARFPGATVERFSAASETSTSEQDLDTFDVFTGGALPTVEVLYLSGLRHGELLNVRHHASLKPRKYRGFNYWTFDQVVGLRVATYLFHLSGRRRKGFFDVAAKLVDLVHEHREVPVAVAVTSKGEVLKLEHGEPFDIESGQTASHDIVSMVDDVYQPFSFSGATVPSLRRPSRYTSVHPSIVRGVPCVSNSRIPVTAIERASRSIRSPLAGSTLMVAERFGIAVEQATDAMKVANDMAAAAKR